MCALLADVPDAQGPDRLHRAVLTLAAGDLDRLGEAVALAQLDWRDLLVAAGDV